MNKLVPVVLASMILLAAPAAYAAEGVALGVAAGIDYSAADQIFEDDSNTSFAWGFFVDIPLLETFVISPQTTIYELEFAGASEAQAVTDVGLNFKFVVPLGSLSLGGGVLAGVTTGLGDYRLHYGALGQLSFNLISNIDAFVLAQYKRIDVGDTLMNEDISKVHAFAGGMFRF